MDKYPQGEFIAKADFKPRDNLELKNVSIVWNYEAEEELVKLMHIRKYYRDNYNVEVFLNMPYVPNSRMDRVKRFFRDEEGVTAIEYGLIAALIAIIIILAVTNAGTALRTLFERVAKELGIAAS